MPTSLRPNAKKVLLSLSLPDHLVEKVLAKRKRHYTNHLTNVGIGGGRQAQIYKKDGKFTLRIEK